MLVEYHLKISINNISVQIDPVRLSLVARITRVIQYIKIIYYIGTYNTAYPHYNEYIAYRTPFTIDEILGIFNLNILNNK